MLPFEKIGLFLVGSPADQVAIDYAGRIAELADSKTLLCISEAEDEHRAPVDSDELRGRISAAMPTALHARIELRVFGRNGPAEMLRAARDDQLDLVVRGRRLPSHQLGNPLACTRLERKSPCSTLIVPAPARVHMSRLLVPVDFSEHSKLALETALQLARAAGAAANERAQVTVETTFAVHYGYQKIGVTLAEAAANIEAGIRRALGAFLAGVDTTGVDFDTVLMCSEQTAQSINEVAAARKMDMVLVGSRGATPSAAAILGETAEYILASAAIPTLVVKKKGETVGLLNALLRGL
jgi:nucleotide-binding universal stress UspA family protein